MVCECILTVEEWCWRQRVKSPTFRSTEHCLNERCAAQSRHHSGCNYGFKSTFTHCYSKIDCFRRNRSVTTETTRDCYRENSDGSVACGYFDCNSLSSWIPNCVNGIICCACSSSAKIWACAICTSWLRERVLPFYDRGCCGCDACIQIIVCLNLWGD